MSIYHAYDIRGTFPEEINEELAYKIGRAYVEFLKPKTVVIGRDARLSSLNLHKALVKGILDQGANVIDIGLCTTPMFYFAIAYYKYDCGAIITASHLPKEFNGIKFCKKNAAPISYEEGLNKIEKIVNKNKFINKKKGKQIKKDILKDYTKFILKGVKKADLKVVVDAGNMMGSIEGKILSKIINVEPLFFKIDGTFPNREIDCSNEENITKLKQEVIKQKADLGIAFDGDADRAAFVDENGKLITAAVAGSLILMDIAKPGSKITYDLTISKTFTEMADKLKIKTIMTKVGHTYVGQVMRKNKVLFGLERSGHYFFKHNFYMDSGLLAAIKLIEYISKSKQPVSKTIESIKQYPSTLINLEVNNKNQALKNISDIFSKDAKKILKLDGISIYHEDYWLNIRKSNTENILRIVIEADNNKKLEEIKNKIKV